MKSAIDSLNSKWKTSLSSEWKKPYFLELAHFLSNEKAEVYPREQNFFTALNKTPLDKVKVIILGQDPYHGEGQAHGLGFSVPEGVKTPPSLRNIYKEIQSDLKIEPPKSGCLSGWAEQGVLLLNATLSVQAGRAGSHQKKGWEEFTDKILSLIHI